MIYRIYRLTDESTIPLFTGSNSLRKLKMWPPKPEDYEQIWEGYNPGSDHITLLNWVYAKFNVAMPMFFRTEHHSLSVGDIVSLTDREKTSTYFCDSIGWTELPEFFKTVSAAE